MKFSIIISIYNNIEYLEIVLKSIFKQTFTDFEIIVAEDANDTMVKKFIEKVRTENPNFKIKHVFQEDRGFRKNKILNEAIKQSEGEYLLFIDGDCILHKNFVKNYSKYVNENSFVYGKRVYLSKILTDILLKKKNLNILNWLMIFLTGGRKIKYAIYNPFLNVNNSRKQMIGSSFSISKKNMLKLNGYDEDYEQPYFGEDTDIDVRCGILGLKKISVFYKSLQYHMWHGGRERKDAFEKSKKMFLEKSKAGNYRCKNGLIKE